MENKKPIFIIKVPIAGGQALLDWIVEKSKHLEGDYYLIYSPTRNLDVEFEMFSSEKITPIQIKELKKKVMEQWEKNHE